MVWECRFQVGWAHLAANGQMRNTAYLDLAAHTRLGSFAHVGFSARRLGERRIGPVIRREQLEYFRELHLLAEVAVDLTLAGIGPDGSRFAFSNESRRPEGELVAKVVSFGCWFNLDTRHPTPPPPELARSIRALLRSPE